MILCGADDIHQQHQAVRDLSHQSVVAPVTYPDLADPSPADFAPATLRNSADPSPARGFNRQCLTGSAHRPSDLIASARLLSAHEG